MARFVSYTSTPPKFCQRAERDEWQADAGAAAAAEGGLLVAVGVRDVTHGTGSPLFVCWMQAVSRRGRAYCCTRRFAHCRCSLYSIATALAHCRCGLCSHCRGRLLTSLRTLACCDGKCRLGSRDAEDGGEAGPAGATDGAGARGLFRVDGGAVLSRARVRTGGSYVAPQDDPYIHLAMAERMAAGYYGINVGEASSPSSSLLWPVLLMAAGELGVGAGRGAGLESAGWLRGGVAAGHGCGGVAGEGIAGRRGGSAGGDGRSRFVGLVLLGNLVVLTLPEHGAHLAGDAGGGVRGRFVQGVMAGRSRAVVERGGGCGGALAAL